MYGFVDTVAGGAQSTSMSIQTIFDGINFDQFLTDESGSFMTLTVSGRSNLRNRINTIEVAGKHGVIESDNTLDPREIIVKYKISDKTNEGFRERYNKLNSLLEGTKKELAFSDEDAIFYATLSENEVPEEDSNELIGTIIFYCSDPYKYGPEQQITFASDTVNVNNNGTAEADPIFQLEVTQPVTFAMIQNQDDEYQMIGRPVETEQTPKERFTQLINDSMSTLVGWGQATTATDGYALGTIETDGIRFYPTSFGAAQTPERWQGPGVVKSLPEEVQDFEMNVTVRNENIGYGNGMVEVYLLDSLDRQIARIHISDSWKNLDKIVGRVQLGHDENRRFPFITEAPNKASDWNNFDGIMKLQRQGARWWFYFARIQDGKRVQVSQMHYTPPNPAWFQERVAKVQIMFRKWPNLTHTRMGVYHLSFWKMNDLTPNDVPYIANPGDIIMFDHVNDELLINGEDRTDLKDFGASYFKLKKGDNALVVHPPDSFNVTCKHRERYR